MKHFNERLTDAHGNYAPISIKSQTNHALIEFGGEGCNFKIEVTDPDQLRAIGHAFHQAAAEMEDDEKFGAIYEEIDDVKLEFLPERPKSPWWLMSLEFNDDEIIISDSDKETFFRLINFIYKGLK